jgi:hypothetical protein
MEEAGESTFTIEHLVIELSQQQRFTEILSCCDSLSAEDVQKGIKKSRLVYNRLVHRRKWM